jgi:hypothetical protein
MSPEQLATASVNLSPYNNVALGAATATQLIPPGPAGHYNLTLIATAAGIFIKNASSVAVADVASFPLPANVPVTIVVSYPSGIWAISTAAANLGALLTPRGA